MSVGLCQKDRGVIKVLSKAQIVFAIFFVSFFHAPAYANDSSWQKEWADLENLLPELSDEEACQKKFDLLWKHARTGNMEARHALTYFLWGFLHMDHNYMPGRTDEVSHNRDRTIVAIHATGPYPHHPELPAEIEDWHKTIISVGLSRSLGSEDRDNRKKTTDLLQCLENHPYSQKCIDFAVNSGLIPSWDAYVDEIDGLIEQGHKPKCTYMHRDHWRKKTPESEESR